MKNSRALAPSLVVLGMIAAGMVGVAGTATADSSQCTTYVSTSKVHYASCAGHGWFQSSGEHFYIEDRVADGHSVALHYTINGVTRTAYNRDGSGGKVVDVNLTLPEGTIVEYKVCLSNDSKDLKGSCSGGFRDAA